MSPNSRRRAVMTAFRVGQNVFSVITSAVESPRRLWQCPGARAGALLALAGLAKAARLRLLPQRRSVRLTVLATLGGLDIAIEDAPSSDPSCAVQLADAAKAAGIARLSIGGEPILSLAEPAIDVAGVHLVPPPGVFVQASAEAEAMMTELIVKHLRGAKRLADLFSGIGTFTFALARHARVHAVEDNAAALEALSLATRRAPGLKPITTERRDLDRHPLSPQELESFDGVVFDPPRNGAKAQATQLAASKVPVVAAVSCNPATFARDARILVDEQMTNE